MPLSSIAQLPPIPLSLVRWMDCGQGTLQHPVNQRPLPTEVVELHGFGRIFEVYHYGNEPEDCQRLIVKSPDLLTLAHEVARLNPNHLQLGAGMMNHLVGTARRLVTEILPAS